MLNKSLFSGEKLPSSACRLGSSSPASRRRSAVAKGYGDGVPWSGDAARGSKGRRHRKGRWRRCENRSATSRGGATHDDSAQRQQSGHRRTGGSWQGRQHNMQPGAVTACTREADATHARQRHTRAQEGSDRGFVKDIGFVQIQRL